MCRNHKRSAGSRRARGRFSSRRPPSRRGRFSHCSQPPVSRLFPSPTHTSTYQHVRSRLSFSSPRRARGACSQQTRCTSCFHATDHGPHASQYVSARCRACFSKCVVDILYSFAAKKYTQDHESVVFDHDTSVGTVAITDYAQSSLGDVVFVELPSVGTVVQQGGTSAR